MQITERTTHMGCDSVKHREESSHVVLPRNTAKELSIGKFCCPETSIKVQRHLTVTQHIKTPITMLMMKHKV